ncbi:hypothetical protein F511_01457 [Dorcoceras hygrometricum]|uniref:Uncharacterized protein n=1 Tax=Dorcoceras hygrometricum TaxID=472368 RepID=A0A2Z7BLV7_9LAMI|nr:hypothetical protein F511_01457 [Dorcoceras hygrometricum]
MEKGPEDAYTCLSFNSYSSQMLAEIAGKVSVENQDTTDDEFEFALAREENGVLPDEGFYRGQTGPVFPVFCRDLLSSYDDDSGENRRLEEVEGIKVPLSKLLEETRRDENDRDPASCSSSEADELESIPAGTYCVWRPKLLSDTPPPIGCKKSKSTGSASKRWKLPEFLRRSNSEGKDSLVLMTPKHRDEKRDKTETSTKPTEKLAAITTAAGPPSAHEALYVQNRAKKENDRKKSYLPYRPDLVGFFATANSLRKSSPRF